MYNIDDNTYMYYNTKLLSDYIEGNHTTWETYTQES